MNAGAEVTLCTTQDKFNNSYSRNPTASTAQTHLARMSKFAKGPIMVPNTTAVQQQESFGAASPVILDQLPTSTKEPGNQLAQKRPVRNRRKEYSVPPADVSMTIDEDGHAMVIDRRQRHFKRMRVGERVNRSSGTHYKAKQFFHASLIRELRWLASSLEREPRQCSVSLLEGVDASIGELKKLRDYIREAERKALTTAFYGKPPGVVLPQAGKRCESRLGYSVVEGGSHRTPSCICLGRGDRQKRRHDSCVGQPLTVHGLSPQNNSQTEIPRSDGS